MPIASSPDHVAVAVHDIEAAAARWHDELGGGWVGPVVGAEEGPFRVRQLRYANGAKLELLQPHRDGFAHAFLARHGPRVHHVTLKVAALLPAVETLRREGYDVVDVHAEGEWHEGFLRPSQVGGLIAQIAWEAQTDDEWHAEAGTRPEAPRGPAALQGPLLRHPDLAAAEATWTALGGAVVRAGDALTVTWDDAPLSLRIEAGATAGPVGLRFAHAPALPADDVAGASVLVE